MFNPAICDMCGDSWHPVQSCPFVNEDAADISASIGQSNPQHRADSQEEVDTCVDKESPDKEAGASKEEQPKHPNVSSYDDLIPNRVPGNRPASKEPEEKPTHPNSSSHDEFFPIQIPGDRPKGKAPEEKPAHVEPFPVRIPGDRPKSKQPEEKPTHPTFSSYDELFPSLRRGDTKPEPNQEKPTHPNFSSYDSLFPSRLHRGDTKPESKPETPIQPTTNSNRAGAKSKEEPYDGYLTGEKANGFGDMREEEMEEAKRACQ